MSFSNGGGGTLTVPSPTHVHHVDVLAGSVRSLRRSLSRSPSKFNLGRTNSQGSDSSQGSSHSPMEHSPCRQVPLATTTTRVPISTQNSQSWASGLSSTPSTIRQPPSAHTPSSQPSPSLKLSLRSGKSAKQAQTPSRPLSKLRSSPKSPLKRALAANNDVENAPPASSTGHDFPLPPSSISRSPLPQSSLPRRPLEKSSRHSLHLDVSGASHQALFRALEGSNNNDMSNIPGTGALKRSDAIMDLDQPNLGSPVAKRRSLHGIASLTQEEADISNNLSSSNRTPSSSFEIHEDNAGNREYALFGAGNHEPLPSPTPTPSAARRAASLRKSTLQQRQNDRASWGRRSGANHLAQMSGEASTPNAKGRPRLSADQFVPPTINRDSPFPAKLPLLNPSAHPFEPRAGGLAQTFQSQSSHQPHPLSKTLVSTSSGNSLQEETIEGSPVAAAVAKPIVHGQFAQSLPYGIGAPVAESKAPGNVTPFRGVERPRAFMSTGLISKVNRNVEEEPKLVMPDTPCKKNSSGFATYPPPLGSASKKPARFAFGASPATPLDPGTPLAPRGGLSNSAKGLAIFQRNGVRRVSLLPLDGEDKDSWRTLEKASHDVPSAASALLTQVSADADGPPTPTKPSLASSWAHPKGGSGSGAESSSDDQSPINAPVSAVRPEISRQSTASPVEQRPPRTPQTSSVLVPDASGLSISNAGLVKSIPAPVTPSGRDSSQLKASRLITPINGRGNHDGDAGDSLYYRFDKVELAGRGEFSFVYRVVKTAAGRSSFLTVFNGTPSRGSPGSPEPDRVYAVKMTRRALLGPKDRENKLREVRALQALTHADHIVQYVDCWEQDRRLYIQTEFCDEGTLDNFLGNVGRKGRLDDFRIWKIIHDICLGVQSIHEAGFMHLDLKPANIFITFEGVLKIGDFGLATTWPAANDVDAEGDREYIGPEILRGKFDRPADIFSLGLIMVEMACNVVLPDNGPTWIALRSGDFSDVPSLTFTYRSGETRDVAGVPTGLSMDDSLIHHTSAPEFALKVGSNPLSERREPEDPAAGMGTSKRPELRSPPDFMCDPLHPHSLDQTARCMTRPEPYDRPTIQQLIASGGLAWVAERRQSAATVFEGPWGPSDEVGSSDEDTEMTGV